MRDLTPKEAWSLLQSEPDALLIDIRMEIESMYVGRPPGAVHVAWYEYPEFTPNPPQFVEQVMHEAGRKDRTVLVLCRSGQRSVDAALALEQHGFTQVINVLHGFEGDLDAAFHRSTVNGWRHDGLPWEQL